MSERGIGNLDYTVSRLDQHVAPLQASVRIAVRPVGNPGTAEGEVWFCFGKRWLQRQSRRVTCSPLYSDGSSLSTVVRTNCRRPRWHQRGH